MMRGSFVLTEALRRSEESHSAQKIGTHVGRISHKSNSGA